jgi:hypothetical protein
MCDGQTCVWTGVENSGSRLSLQPRNFRIWHVTNCSSSPIRTNHVLRGKSRVRLWPPIMHIRQCSLFVWSCHTLLGHNSTPSAEEKLRHASGWENTAARCTAVRETKDKDPPSIFEAPAVRREVETGDLYACIFSKHDQPDHGSK